LFEWISENPQGATLLATIFIAVATVIYAVLTGFLVRETIKMRRAQTEPKLAAFFEPNEQAIIIGNVYIKNIGLGPAYDITFELIPDGNLAGAERLIEDFKETKFLERGVNYLGPGQWLRTGFTQLNENQDEKMKAVVRVRMQYRGAARRKPLTDEYRIDFSELEGFGRLGTPPLQSMAKTMEKMQKNIERVVNGMRHIKVDRYDQADRNQERFEAEEDMRRRREQSEQNSGE